MNNLGAVYIGELKKTWKGSKKYVFLAIFVVVLLLMSVVFEVLNSSAQMFPEQGTIDAQQAKEQIEIQIEAYQQQIADGEVVSGPMDQQLHQLQALLAMCDYCIEKGIPVNLDQSWYSLGFDIQSLSMSNFLSADGYMQFAMTGLFSIILIMVSVLAAGGITNEFKNGTIKLMLMRPIKRSEFLMGKSLSVMTYGAGALILGFLITFIYGASRFGLNMQNVFAYFEGAVFEMGASRLILNFVFYLFMLFCFMELISFIAILSPNTHLAMIIGLVLALIGELWQLLLGYTYLGYASFTINMDLSQFFTLNGSVMNGMNFYAAFVLLAVYLAVLISVKYIAFQKRDI